MKWTHTREGSWCFVCPYGGGTSYTAPSLPASKKFLIGDFGDVPSIPVLPCPWETRKIPCNRCRLCLRAPLPGNPVIGFRVHGNASDISVPLLAVRKKRLVVVG